MAAAFGHISWQPPAWLCVLLAALRRHRRAVACAVLALAVLAVASRMGWRAYRNRPRPPEPHYVRAVAVVPGVPGLGAEDPPPLTVDFDESVAPLALLRADVPPGLVRLDPPEPGTWTWTNEHRLLFRPAHFWPPARDYRVTIDPAALAPHVLLRNYHVNFRSPGFDGEFSRVEFYQNPEDPGVKQVTATLTFTHAVDPAELERRLSVRMLGSSPVFGSPTPERLVSLLPSRRGREFFLRTVSLTLPEHEDTLKLRLAPGLPAAANSEARLGEVAARVTVPDLYSFFRFKETRAGIVKDKTSHPDQLLFLETTCLARPEDLAKSLEVYVLPTYNPARHRDAEGNPIPEEKAAASAEDDEEAEAGDQASGASDDEDEDNEGAGRHRYREARGDHDGRFHSDDASNEGTEGADQLDTPTAFDDWSPPEVDAAVLARSRRLPITLVPAPAEQSRVHTFRLRDDTPGQLFVRVRKDTAPAPGGYRLADDYTATLNVPIPEKEISIGGDGGLLALSGERKLLISSRGVPAIRYEIARVPAGEINHLASQTEGDFQRPEFRRPSLFNEQDLARIASETQTIALKNPVESNYSSFDFTAHLQPAPGLDREGLFFFTASAWDPKTNRYVRQVTDSRFVLVTDLGLIVKRNADGSRDVFTASLAHGTPFGGVEVSILARNGGVLASAPTDAAGRASLPALGKNPRDSREPVAIVARRGGDVAFLPYERRGRQLDYSRFPVDGVETRTGKELDAFVFTERGVYRPGDTVHVGVIVKQRDWNGSLDGLPLETEVIDAREQATRVEPLVLPASGFAEWTFDTRHDSPTGGYTLNMYLTRNGQRGTLLGSTTVQVKEFQPDRLKLDVALSKTAGPSAHGWVSPDDLKGRAVLKNLYGTAAADHVVKAHLRLNPRGFNFKEFPGYTFYDRLREGKKDWEGETIELGETHTDDDGAAAFSFDLGRFADVTYRLTFDAEGFEKEGGRSVEDLTGILVSPLPYVVGWHADGDLNWITARGPGRLVDFVAVDPALNRLPLPKLTLHLAEQQFISVLTKGEDGNYRYESVRRERTVRDEHFPSSPSADPAAPAAYRLPDDTPGCFVVELRDADGHAVSRLEYTVVGQGQVSRSLEKNAELEVHLSKEQYRAGEDIEVSITAPYAGSGLITVERERVYTHRWFTSTGTGSVQRITIPPDFDGTGYVNVAFVRALDSKEIFMSPLSYAAVPFTANMEHRRLGVELHAAEKSKPGEPLLIRYRTDRPAKIAVFAVDQGILQVTRFPLPDPLAHQFRKSALTVRTSQIVDLLLPEFSLLRAVQAAGGDGDPGVLNPFRRVTEKPVVYWSGIVDADATERTLTYPVPDYFNGTLTIMAVAVSPDALGNAKTSTLCRNAFVLTPAVPTLAAPGDEFEVGLTIANGQTGSGPDARVTVQAEPGPGLQVLQGPKEPLAIPEGREASTTFRVRALDRLGGTELGFRANAGGEDSRVHATLSIRPAMPFRTVVTGGNFQGSLHDLPVSGSTLYPEFRHLDTGVSTLPLGLARGLDRYLHDYPHGCSEQITSGAFARLALADVADFGLTRAEAARQIAETIRIERGRQNDTGGFGYWQSSKTEDFDFVTVYVMHFLSEAKAGGYPVPEDMFNQGLAALRRTAGASPWTLQQARIQAYALYVLTREGVVTTNHLLTLRDYLDQYYKKAYPNDLTAVYLAGCWSLLKKEDEARRLIAGYKMGRYSSRDWWDFYQPLNADSQYVAILARHFPDLLRKLSPGDFERIVSPVSQGSFSTLSAAYAVLALKAYSEALSHDAPRLSVAALYGPKVPEKPLPLEGKNGAFLRGSFPPSASGLRFHADGGKPAFGVFYQATESGFDHRLPTEATAHGIEVYRDLLDADGKRPVTTLGLRDRVTVRLRLRAAGGAAVTNVAVLDLLPGGFGIAGDSLHAGAGVAGMDYVDVREDRAVFYGTLTSQVREITYQIKPTARGTFVVPPIFATSMYDKATQSIGLPGHLTVTAEK